MRSISRQRSGISRASMLVVLGCGAIAGLTTISGGQTGARHFEPVTGTWILSGMTYLGDASCSSASCHGSDEAKMQSGQMIGDESIIWSSSDAGDPHAKAWKTLKSADSKAIAAKLSVADPVTSDRCLSCHALNAPAAQRDAKFNIETGNSCESCHGPSERWSQPHAKEGWTKAQRKSLGTAGLMKDHGLFDTSDLTLRAELCLSCHLQIGKDMLDAGHPALQFELYGYNNYLFLEQFATHWDEPEGQMMMARQWAVGQASALDASQRQVAAWKSQGWDTSGADALVALYSAGTGVARKHFGADTPAGLSQASYTPEKCAAAAKDLAELGAGAKSTIDRRVIAFGVMALAEATFDARDAEAPDELWDAFDIASKGAEGAAYLDALKKMASLAK